MQFEFSRLFIIRLFTFLLGAIFVFAGIKKWMEPTIFELSLFRSDFFPERLVWLITWTIPLFEISLGIMCMISVHSHLAIRFIFILTICYTLFLLIEWMRGISLDCGCFGSSFDQWPYPVLFIRNVFFYVLS